MSSEPATTVQRLQRRILRYRVGTLSFALVATLLLLLVISPLVQRPRDLTANRSWWSIEALWIALPFLVLLALAVVARRLVFLDRDVLLLLESQQARATAEALYRSLFERSQDGILVLDPHGRVEEANSRALELLEYAAEELSGTAVEDLFSNSRVAAAFRERLASGQPFPAFEARLATHSGASAFCLLSGTPVSDRDGGAGALLLVRDLVGSREAAERLWMTELRYKSLLENLQVGLFELDPDQRFVLANGNFCAMTGYRESELAGLPVRAVFPEGIGKEGAATAEVPLLHRDGSRHWVRLDRPGTPRGWGSLQICTDVTERRLAQERQEQLSEKLQSVANIWRATVDQLPDPLVIVDGEDHIVRVNEAAALLLVGGYGEIIGASLSRWEEAEPWHSAQRILADSRTRGESATTHVEDGRGRTWVLAALPVEGHPEEQATHMVLARDITELVALQRSLQRNELTAALGALVAGVAHEVRNPLFGISATIDAFEAEFGTNPSHRQYIEVLRGELQRMRVLMQDLLDYGKPIHRENTPTEIHELIHEASGRCAVLARERGIELALELEPDLPALTLDPRSMTVVLKNLFENAIHHSPPSSVVQVTAARDDGGVRIEVRDQGNGFRPEDLRRAFEPFFTRRRGGTGLGLSIVQRVVEQHGGQVCARNHPEGGAVVALVLH
jgi:PAS domain S-box-containing protein